MLSRHKSPTNLKTTLWESAEKLRVQVKIGLQGNNLEILSAFENWLPLSLPYS